jgi:hypothetical protein
LHHRVKNTLATVIAITSQSLRTAETLEKGRLTVESRLMALGKTHDLMLQANWARTPNKHIRRIISADASTAFSTAAQFRNVPKIRRTTPNNNGIATSKATTRTQTRTAPSTAVKMTTNKIVNAKIRNIAKSPPVPVSCRVPLRVDRDIRILVPAFVERLSR